MSILFGDPRHSFRQTTETARKAAVKGKRASPWSKSAMCTGDIERAARQFDDIKAKTGIDLTKYSAADELIEAINIYRSIRGDWRHSLAELRRTLALSIESLDKAGFAPQEKAA